MARPIFLFLLFLAASSVALAATPPTTSPAPSPALPTVLRDDAQVVVQNNLFKLRIDLAAEGAVTVEWPNGIRLAGATAGVRLLDADQEMRASAAATHTAESVEIVHDAFGDGVHIAVAHATPGRPLLRQHVWVYADRPEWYTRLDVVADDGQTVTTREIVPLIIGGSSDAPGRVSLGTRGMPGTLTVPYDNDGYTRYGVTSDDATSFEVAALFDSNSRHGLVLGSVTHDTWKTGVRVGTLADDGTAALLRVFGGVVDPKQTWDREPHGPVTGTTVASPRIFVGAFDDWRGGMEAFGRANALLKPPLAWNGGIPFGWNSWAAHKTKLNERHVAAAIDMTAALREEGFANDGVAYVNLDSFWDNMSDATLSDLSRRAHARGLRFGLYHTPFSYWGDNLDAVVPGTDERYHYRDLVLKTHDGQPIKHSGYVLDPTHPGTRLRNRAVYDRFARIGVDFVKLDFMTNGALEGNHFDPAITTGTAAYNRGMRDLVEDLSPARMGRPVFLSLSIAPLFPHGYGHSRRISCDAFSTLGATEYLLNNAGYGWWTQGTLYSFNDPDHAVVYQTMDERVVSEAEGQTRLHASIVGGGMLLNSDDATNEKARERAARLFENNPLIDLARVGRAFRPIEAEPGQAGVDAFVSVGKPTYVAVFNFDENDPVTREVRLDRIGTKHPSSVLDVRTWEPVGKIDGGVWRVELAPATSVIVRMDE